MRCWWHLARCSCCEQVWQLLGGSTEPSHAPATTLPVAPKRTESGVSERSPRASGIATRLEEPDGAGWCAQPPCPAADMRAPTRGIRDDGLPCGHFKRMRFGTCRGTNAARGRCAQRREPVTPRFRFCKVPGGVRVTETGGRVVPTGAGGEPVTGTPGTPFSFGAMEREFWRLRCEGPQRRRTAPLRTATMATSAFCISHLHNEVD